MLSLETKRVTGLSTASTDFGESLNSVLHSYWDPRLVSPSPRPGLTLSSSIEAYTTNDFTDLRAIQSPGVCPPTSISTSSWLSRHLHGS
ncbi:hypothetical protein R1flu_007216 [Riccia fluitans]|uniref:Uncharacterized protein n=1 Tax=Riccia fluitans TaxID=41844 RepID=A0ABD1Z2B7_9MARC